MASVLAVPQCGQVKVDFRITALSSIGVTQVEQHEPCQQAGRGQTTNRRLGANASGRAKGSRPALAPQQNGPARKAEGGAREQSHPVWGCKDSDAVQPGRPKAEGGEDEGQAAA